MLGKGGNVGGAVDGLSAGTLLWVVGLGLLEAEVWASVLHRALRHSHGSGTGRYRSAHLTEVGQIQRGQEGVL